jgi:hypothetical protein
MSRRKPTPQEIREIWRGIFFLLAACLLNAILADIAGRFSLFAVATIFWVLAGLTLVFVVLAIYAIIDAS